MHNDVLLWFYIAVPLLSTAGADYELTLPKIIHFPIAIGQRLMEIDIPITDDSIAEDLETFQLRLVAADAAVEVLQDITMVTIVDDELEAFFVGDTPRVVGNTIVVQGGSNMRTATIRCQLSSGARMDCKYLHQQ